MENDFETRKASFLEDYKALIDKYQVDWASFPMFNPNERGTWDMTIQTSLVDTKNQPIKSPFVVQN